MPGFYEHDEADEELGMVPDAAEGEDYEPLETNIGDTAIVRMRPRPPVSAPARSTSSGRQQNAEASTSRSRTTGKPHSTSHIREPFLSRSRSAELNVEPPSETEAIGTGTLQCPICTKTLETDNQGFNTHIDFCLSRGAIMAAQTKAKSPTKSFKSREKKSAKTTHGKWEKG
jgi:DNA polymerase kappa